MCVSGVPHVVRAFARRVLSNDRSNASPEGFAASRCRFAQERLELGKHLLDRILIGRVWRQQQQLRAAGLNRFAYAGNLVAGQIVSNDDVARAECRRQELFDIGAKRRAIDRTVQDQRGDNCIVPEASEKCCCLPMPAACSPNNT